MSVPANTVLAPLVFKPRLVEKIWGGRKLQTVLNKPLPATGNFGEAWEIYDFPPGFVSDAKEGAGWTSAEVADGPLAGNTLHSLMTEHAASLLGDAKPVSTPAGPQFPLLLKYLDAREDLSIQVHPTADYAAKHPDAHLKTECWIVLDAAKGAKLYKGLKDGVTKDAFEKAIKAGNVETLIDTVPAREGECHFLPSGTVHALGGGILIAEVQTPSDTTYRVFDFNRKENGKPRKLHVEESLANIDFTPGVKPPLPTSMKNLKEPLVDCEFFKTITLKIAAHQLRPLPRGKMKLWMIADGTAKVRWSGGSMTLTKGQSVLFPASMPPNATATFSTNGTVLETTVK